MPVSGTVFQFMRATALLAAHDAQPFQVAHDGRLGAGQCLRIDVQREQHLFNEVTSARLFGSQSAQFVR